MPAESLGEKILKNRREKREEEPFLFIQRCRGGRGRERGRGGQIRNDPR